MERKNAAAAAEAESTRVDAVAQETERRSMKRRSKAENQRGGTAQHEHGRQDGWTSTLRGSGEEKKCSQRDRIAGSDCRINAHLCESKVKKMHTKSTQEKAAAAAATCGQGSDCRNNAHMVTSILNTIQKNISVHKFHIKSKWQVPSCSIPEECLDKDAEILRLIEERRSMPKEEKQRLKT